MRNFVLVLLVPLIALCGNVFAKDFQYSGALTQGGYITGKINPEYELYVPGTGRKVYLPITTDGRFFYGLERHTPASIDFELRTKNGEVVQTIPLIITPRDFPTEIIKGVPQKTVTPDPEQVARSRKDSAGITAARSQLTDQLTDTSCFNEPAQGRHSGFYGSRRTYNGAERSWHKGLDIAAPTGTPVAAPMAGQVTFAGDTFFNGNLIIIDHGLQLFTIYAHLDRMDVQVGDVVTKGRQIGLVGTTGRSTGPHLHWGAYWRNTAIDPQLLLDHWGC